MRCVRCRFTSHDTHPRDKHYVLTYQRKGVTKMPKSLISAAIGFRDPDSIPPPNDGLQSMHIFERTMALLAMGAVFVPSPFSQ